MHLRNTDSRLKSRLHPQFGYLILNYHSFLFVVTNKETSYRVAQYMHSYLHIQEAQIDPRCVTLYCRQAPMVWSNVVEIFVGLRGDVHRLRE
jgi:hypothetical protein